ncbi:MAG: hypothetical protein ACFFD4_29490 [Candidatus Odinarchaeota archaeon]
MSKMIESNGKPTFVMIWGILCAIVFFSQFIVELTGFISSFISGFPDLTVIIDLVVWRADILAVFGSLTIFTVFTVGVTRIVAKNDYSGGTMFIIVGTGLATIMGLFFLSFNFADLLSAIIGTLGEKPEPFEWSFTPYGALVTWIITLPAFTGIKYLEGITSRKK